MSTHSIPRLLAILGLLAALAICPTSAFWLTDGSLFQQQSVAPQSVELLPAQKLSSTLTTTDVGLSEQGQLEARNQRPESNSSGASSRSQESSVPSRTSEPWLELTDTRGPQKSGLSPTQDQANDLVAGACQCDAGWLQNQTSALLNKWLSAPHFASHVRSLVLTSSLASGGRSTLARGNSQAARNSSTNHHGRNRTSLAWSKRNERPGHEAAAPAAGAKPLHARHVGAHPGYKWQNATLAQQPATAAAAAAAARLPTQSVRVIQGERGPKGDRGEQGPSCLISVKDRDALFDLAPVPLAVASVQASQPGESASAAPSGAPRPAPRLVFVESEQILVLETAGPSWRPIPLLAPLHDFRKTIAKFSLNSNDEQRLVLQAGASGLAVSPGGAAVNSARVSTPTRPNKVVLLNSSTDPTLEQVLERALGKSDGLSRVGGAKKNADRKQHKDEDEADESDDDEEDDDDDDEDDDDAGKEDDLNMEEDELDEDDDDDDDENEIDANLRVNGKPRAVASLIMTNKIPLDAGRAKKRARSQVSGRSAMSPALRDAPSASEGAATRDNSGESLANSISTGADQADSEKTPDTMKLRLVALNEPFSGNQHGLRGANFECKRNAARAGVKGAFRAFLATNYQNLIEIVRYNSHVQKYPIVNLRGDIVASSWHDLFRAQAHELNPLGRIQSFDGRHVASDPNWPNKLVWLGTGNKFGQRESGSHNCDGWHSDSLNKLGFATPLHSPKAHHNQQLQRHSDRKRSHQRRLAAIGAGHSNASTSGLVFEVIEKYPCRMPLIVLCIETVAQAES